MRDENVISWNLANILSVWLMIGLLWAAMGIASHMFYRKSRTPSGGVASTGNGDLLVAA